MKNFFKPEDFKVAIDVSIGTPHLLEFVTKVANEKLNALIESWPVVTGFKCGDGQVTYGSEDYKSDTHKARLAFIEEIVKEPCKHKPAHFESDDRHINCKYCGVELQATWSEVKK